MSKIKKLLAILLSMAMILGMSLTTFAAGTDAGSDAVVGTKDDTGTIEVTGIKNETGKNITVTAYKIVGAEYNAVPSGSNQATFSGYKNLYDPGIADLENPTVDELYAIKKQIDENKVPGTELGEGIPDGEYLEFSKDGFEVGSYLIVVSGSEATTYSLAIASIRYLNKEGNWALDAEELDMLASDPAWVKSMSGPTVDKTVKNSDANTTPGNYATADIGDELTYTVTINPVPKYDGKYPVLNITDKLSTGLVFTSTKEDVTVEAYTSDASEPETLTNNSDYTISIENDELKVDFVVDGEYKLNDYAGGRVVITYTVKVTDDVQQNQDPNTNDVTLTYSKDSNIEGNDGTDEDKTYTYTFDIDGAVDGSLTEGIITKVGETVTGQDSQPLEGAVFQLYTSYNANTGVSDPYNRVSDPDKGVTAWDGKVTSDEKGQLKMQGLEGNKTYYLKEIQAPTGYSLSDKIYSITINMNCNDDGQLIDYTITIKDVADPDSNTNKIYYDNDREEWVIDRKPTDIPNTTIGELPSTGGIGTTIFTIGGCVIMIAAAGLYFASRRKENK